MHWEELKKGLLVQDPSMYLTELRHKGVMKEYLPEIDALFGVPQTPEHHPEIDTGIHTLMVVKRAAELSNDVAVRFAALVHDLGKALTPPDQWPQHINHENAGVTPVRELCTRLNVPAVIREFSVKVARYHLKAHRAFEMRPGKIVKLFQDLNAFESPTLLDQFVDAVQADAQGRLGKENIPYHQGVYLREALQSALEVDTDLPEQILISERVKQVSLVKKRFE